MTEYIDREPNHVLDNLKSELSGKEQGYATELVLADEPFSDNRTPRIEIVLIDPKNNKIAFRRASRAIRGSSQNFWKKGNIVRAVEEGLTWMMEM